MSVNWGAVVSKASPITDPNGRRRLINTIISIITHNLLMKSMFFFIIYFLFVRFLYINTQFLNFAAGFVTGLGVGFKLG
jgi:hypothetical protein